jgi:hypothetical protein
MSETTAGRNAAGRLIQDKETLARAVTARLYAENPALLEKHGERGREKCLQDMRYNIEHLIPAVDLENESMFADYVRWLDNMLGSRGVSSRDVTRCLELLGDEVHSRFGRADAGLIARVLAAGVAAVGKSA